MTSEKNPVFHAGELRQRAEAQVLEREARLPEPLAPEAARQLLHELQVHEIELQLQNEELQRAQAELEATRTRYFDLYDLAPVGYLTLDEHGLIAEANLRAAELLGVPRKALAQMPLSRFILPEDQDLYYLHLRQLLADGNPQGCEVRLARGDAAPFWGRLESTVVPDPKGALGYSVLLSDINDRRLLQQELVRTERLRAVGELAAGVSHNLNNLLTAIVIPAEMMLLNPNDHIRVVHLAKTILEATSRATDLVHQLHVSVRNDSPEPLKPINLGQAIEEAVAVTRPRWKDEPEAQGLAIKVHLALGETPRIKGNPTGLHDMLANLLLNAVDAMPQGGTITLRTETDGQFVKMYVSDTGVGMTEETRRRVFEPFFTTKTNVGTGLGLSTLYNTITLWGGTAAVESTPGKGTSFVLSFPVWDGVNTAASTPGDTASSRRGRILVADDDEAVGAVLRQMLGRRHEVSVFIGGREALEDFGPGKYDVAILDLGMPEFSGDQVAIQMRVLDPAIGLILFSGWELPPGDPRGRAFDFEMTKPVRGLAAFDNVVARAIALRDGRLALAEEG